MRAAVIDPAGAVVNIVLVDDDNEYDPGDGHQVIEIDDTSAVGPGWTYDDGTWIDPGPITPPPAPMSTEAWLQQQINDLTDLILFG